MNSKWLYHPLSRTGQHLIFWAATSLVFLSLFKYGPVPGKADYLYTFLFQLSIVPAMYLNLYVLLPRFLQKQQYLLFFPLLIILVLLSSWINYKFFASWSVYLFPDYYFISYFTLWQVALYFCIYLFLSSLLHFSKSWFVVQEIQQRLLLSEKEQIETELKALQAQINPHFFFNTLNGIYSMSLVQDTRLPGMILQLSNLMRYMLYEVKEHKVLLEKEWDIVKHYIALQQLRASNDLQINVSMDGEFQSQLIPTMIIIPLVENAFKHGAKGNTGKVMINIKLSVETSEIILLIENTMGKGEEVVTEARGLGLQNVKRRLDLLYPNQYILSTRVENGKFIALLELKV